MGGLYGQYLSIDYFHIIIFYFKAHKNNYLHYSVQFYFVV